MRNIYIYIHLYIFLRGYAIAHFFLIHNFAVRKQFVILCNKFYGENIIEHQNNLIKSSFDKSLLESKISENQFPHCNHDIFIIANHKINYFRVK